MKVSHECMLKGKEEVETGIDFVQLDIKEKNIIIDAMEEYCNNHKRRKNAKKLYNEMCSMLGVSL